MQVGVCVHGLPPDLCQGCRDSVTLPVVAHGEDALGCSSPREPGCAAQIAGVEMPIHLVSACAVVFLHGMGWLPSAALSSQLHPERTLRSCPSSTEQGSSSPQQRTSLALMFSASALSLLAWSLCTPLQANFGIPQYWKTLSWLDFRHPFDVTGFQCGLTHNYTV